MKYLLPYRGVDWQEAESLQEVAADVEVLYQTRIQKERFQDRPEDYEKARGKYIINKDVMKILPQKSVVMHPLPRVDEVRSMFYAVLFDHLLCTLSDVNAQNVSQRVRSASHLGVTCLCIQRVKRSQAPLD